MKFDDLSPEAQETVKGMVEFCINAGYCMGMEQGRDLETDEWNEETKQLIKFCES
jgi:hypothetical protein